MEEDNHHLIRPLLNPSTTNAAVTPPLDHHHILHNLNLNPISSNSSIILRLSLVAFIGIVSIWANHEASKGYTVTIVNESADTFAGKRFHLFYISNDEATRVVVKASKIIENFLYPDSFNNPTKKKIKHIVVKLSDGNSTDNYAAYSKSGQVEFVLGMSPSIVEGTNFRQETVLAMQRGVARIWLWGGPRNLIDGIVEYMIVNKLGGSFAASSLLNRGAPPESPTAWWRNDDSIVVAELLNRCERRRPGFIRRLNQVMKKNGWDDGKLDGEVHSLCTSCYDSLRYNCSTV